MSTKSKEEVKNIDIIDEEEDDDENKVTLDDENDDEDNDEEDDSEYEIDDCTLTNVDMYHILKNFLENDNGDRCVGESLSIIADKLSKIEEHIKSYVKHFKKSQS